MQGSKSASTGPRFGPGIEMPTRHYFGIRTSISSDLFLHNQSFLHSGVDSQLTHSNFSERAQLSIVGQNRLSDHHVEANDALAVVNSSEVKRSVYSKKLYGVFSTTASGEDGGRMTTGFNPRSAPSQ